ncbi:MAG: ATP-binding protein [Thermoanaerobaculia bacterium]|nr:ATP-binding protein [Thermoanaerobaculia bacterium]
MIEALRGLGYTPWTALADIIDNSISAEADTVTLSFVWKHGASHITVLDNGTGMDSAGLDKAMRMGELSPLDVRASRDLGRFGLGLKTASFSQCRRLTVASKKDGELNCLRWDLDVLARSQDDGWHLLEGPSEDSVALISFPQDQRHGTLVLWEVLDRIVSPGFSEQDFLDLVDGVEQHLALVFHRYLEGSAPRLRILINGRPVLPRNPFLPDHPATWSSPIEQLRTDSGLVEVQCHVLPHKDRLEPRLHELAAGPDGWTAHQGFYVYRNERLLVAGSWLGLGQGRVWTKEESHRLARIRVDIPNTADASWRIDVRKSTARPPVSIKARLTRLAEDTRERARRVFAHRGQIVRAAGQEPVAQAWRAEHTPAGMRYRIDDSHPAVKHVLDEAGPLARQIRAMLRIIEETVPIQRIWLDTAEGKEVPRTGFGTAPSEVTDVLRVMFHHMTRRQGLTPELARQRLLSTEPFHNYPDLVAALESNVSPTQG